MLHKPIATEKSDAPDLHRKFVVVIMLSQADFPSTANLPEVLLEGLVNLLYSGL